jgi:hypothetical protein
MAKLGSEKSHFMVKKVAVAVTYLTAQLPDYVVE